MRDTNEYGIEQEDDSFIIEKVSASSSSADHPKRTKPHIIRRNIEDYLERKALERRLKDVFDDRF